MVRLLIIVILIVVVLSLLGVNITSLLNNKALRENATALWRWVVFVWDAYLKAPLLKGLDYLFDKLRNTENAIRNSAEFAARSTMKRII